MANLRGSFSNLQDPTEPLAHGAMILFSGVLLITPGFFTDFVGFALLIPAVRSTVFEHMKSRVKVQGFQMGTAEQGHSSRKPDDRVVDGDFEDITDQKAGQNSPSGWTKD